MHEDSERVFVRRPRDTELELPLEGVDSRNQATGYVDVVDAVVKDAVRGLAERQPERRSDACIL